MEMAQKSKEKQQIQQEILDNRRAIQCCEVQMSGVRTLIARYEDEYDDLRSAIGNLSTVIQNIEGIQTYYNHVICTYTGEIHRWWGSEYNYADLEFGHIDTDVENCQTQVEDMQTQMREKRFTKKTVGGAIMGSLHIDLDTLQLGMKEVTDAIGDIHKVNTEYKQEGVTSLPSYQALQEQLEMLDKLSDSMKDIMMLVTQSVTNAYTALLGVDAQAAEDMNK